jgi:hypothetical protein
VLDERFVDASPSRAPRWIRRRHRASGAAGVTELALTFSGAGRGEEVSAFPGAPDGMPPDPPLVPSAARQRCSEAE